MQCIFDSWDHMAMLHYIIIECLYLLSRVLSLRKLSCLRLKIHSCPCNAVLPETHGLPGSGRAEALEAQRIMCVSCAFDDLPYKQTKEVSRGCRDCLER